ncbi:S-adenosyl-L-methionine-dependent methyltransferase [Emericellopsis atlantica]|uniref:S-adenosyl-L-methionine-dependent methyltransferase n=1 Tax=Emericellopsis atlantica TaxID=2614577 RepID=A0A9P7ZPW9_9HYPO|nr:S-adenosyl-L-methionine-dependent methyltransferase [Emericellopsis atlantica]KAG9255682.1 S-adenosyl-L-methionine-dependent methyltransferase [Emericellopsis atlantica]
MSQSQPMDGAATFNQMAADYDALIGGATRALFQHVLTLMNTIKPMDSSSVVLDNACGTCVVTAEILAQAPDVRLHAVDVAPNMVQLAKAKFGDRDNVRLAVMPGEQLDFPDDTFTHSVTNLGILFFESPAKGAREIYRTLQPGGVAAVTSWARLGNFEDAINPAQRAARPNEPVLHRLPIKPEWFDAEHAGQVMRDAGFEDVRVSTKQVRYGAATREALVSVIVRSGRQTFLKDYTEGELKVYEEALDQAMETKGARYTMPDGQPGWGVTMDGIVVVCCK